MKTHHIRLVTFGLAATLATACYAQNYPVKPLVVVVPLAAASATDILMRVMSPKMSESLGQQIAIENLPGAAGMLGGERVARAAPDGYTLGGFSDSVVNGVPLLYTNVPYDPFTSFVPVGMVAWVTFVMIAHPSVPARTAKDLIALAKKAYPTQLDYASGGSGSPMHIAMEVFKSASGVSLHHIPYRGSITGVLDVVGGRIPVMITSLGPVLENIKAGKLRALGIASTQRSPLLPAVPTVSESGVPGFVYSSWQAVYLPKGAARPIVDLLNAEIVKALNDPAIRDRLIKLAFEPATSTPEQLAIQTRGGYDKMAKVIIEAGIKAE